MPKNLGLYNDDLSTPRKKDVDACYGPNNAPPYPVTSVNGQTGAVELNDIKYTVQALTSEQKSQARVNIGAGTSNFDGDYNSLTNRPTVTKVILKTWTASDMS